MIRTLLVPTERRISIEIPAGFVGQEVEIIAFTTGEVAEKTDLPDKPLTHLAAEASLATDWLTPEEDQAWQTL